MRVISALHAGSLASGGAVARLHRATAVAAVRADVPLQLKQVIAARAGAVQLRTQSRMAGYSTERVERYEVID